MGGNYTVGVNKINAFIRHKEMISLSWPCEIIVGRKLLQARRRALIRIWP